MNLVAASRCRETRTKESERIPIGISFAGYPLNLPDRTLSPLNSKSNFLSVFKP